MVLTNRKRVRIGCVDVELGLIGGEGEHRLDFGVARKVLRVPLVDNATVAVEPPDGTTLRLHADDVAADGALRIAELLEHVKSIAHDQRIGVDEYPAVAFSLDGERGEHRGRETGLDRFLYCRRSGAGAKSGVLLNDKHARSDSH